MSRNAERIDSLLDAIELIEHNQREDARAILRALIRDDSHFEEAWLWMSVAVDSLDQSVICLDHVLRINPDNWQAAGALYRLREDERRSEKLRARLRFKRDLALVSMWGVFLFVLYAVLFGWQV